MRPVWKPAARIVSTAFATVRRRSSGTSAFPGSIGSSARAAAARTARHAAARPGTAFLRRIRFAVQFPFPGPEERAAIWKRIFPRRLPTEQLDVTRLARLSVAGGNIRNIAVNAAFGAARDDSPVTMRHLLEAARSEFVKLEKPLPSSETEGWA